MEAASSPSRLRRFGRYAFAVVLVLMAGSCAINTVSSLSNPWGSTDASLSGGIALAAAFGAYLLVRRR